MSDTTPDYAGLIERLLDFDVISEPFEPDDAVKAWNYLVGRAHEAATALRALLESNAALERERDQLLDKLHCMCGSPIDHSAWEGHTPVSVYDYSLDQERSRAEAAEASLASERAAHAETRKALEQIERKICAAEHGHTINDVLANYREVRRTVQDARAARRAREQGGER